MWIVVFFYFGLFWILQQPAAAAGYLVLEKARPIELNWEKISTKFCQVNEKAFTASAFRFFSLLNRQLSTEDKASILFHPFRYCMGRKLHSLGTDVF